MKAHIQAFFESVSDTVSYVLSDGKFAAVIDSVLDFDAASGRISTKTADMLLAYLRDSNLTLQWILETHAHTDHLSAASYLKSQAGGRTAISEHICAVQAHFQQLYNLGSGFAPDGRQFDRLLGDNEILLLGGLQVRTLLVPGHTPADLAYQVGDAVFVGDTLFMPDVGTARTDFPGGSAQTLYRSIQRLLALPDTMRLLHCHDYPPAGRRPSWESTVAAQRARNIHVHDGISEAQFVALRQARDATLPVPRLILPALQVNIRAGSLPPKESNGISYLKIPVNALG
ncbi:MAG TPA: MBL fold metallo-hydrolase [Castellaniella sp.]|uniref:MBL fold metallo-hydrolase n=1 Tax=Castellaniella sp. TaxID=1955812 RepID=UPI002EDF634B